MKDDGKVGIGGKGHLIIADSKGEDYNIGEPKRQKTEEGNMDNIKSRASGEMGNETCAITIGNGLQGPTGSYHYVARRLIPTECARLQGFPPDWCEDVPHTDSAEYKLWGNGISLPVLLPMFKAMRARIEKEQRGSQEVPGDETD